MQLSNMLTVIGKHLSIQSSAGFNLVLVAGAGAASLFQNTTTQPMIDESSDDENPTMEHTQTLHVPTPLLHAPNLSLKLNW